jgi:hypothetical protein
MSERLDEMKIATGWENISFREDYYVVSFSVEDAPKIKGLKAGRSNFFLNFDSFNDLPIVFDVSIDNVQTQFFTLGQRLHRVGAPAFISYNSKTNYVSNRWYWNGLLHRMDGPAVEAYEDLSYDESMKGYVKKHFKRLSAHWYREGVAPKFGQITSASIDDGYFMIDAQTNKYNNPEDGFPAFKCERAVFNIETSPDILSEKSALIPSQITLPELTESYKSGVLIERDWRPQDGSFNWCRNGNTLQGGYKHKGLHELSEVIRESLSTDLGLWEGPFYKDPQTEVIVITEFDRLCIED